MGMQRRGVNKGRSSRSFGKNTKKTKAANITNPMRGGIRL